MEKLKSTCPNCGSPNIEIKEFVEDGGKSYTTHIICNDCSPVKVIAILRAQVAALVELAGECSWLDDVAKEYMRQCIREEYVKPEFTKELYQAQSARFESWATLYDTLFNKAPLHTARAKCRELGVEV